MKSTFAIAALFFTTATSLALAQTADNPPPLPHLEPGAKCTKVQRDVIAMQLDALKGMKSSVGQTAKDFCDALDKSEDRAMREHNGLLADIIGLIKKHSDTEVDVKSISKMCKANQHVPAEALDEQITALEKAALACQDPI